MHPPWYGKRHPRAAAASFVHEGAPCTDPLVAPVLERHGQVEGSKATRDLVRDFADMLCHLRGERLEAWAGQAEASPVSELRGLSKGLRKDWAAVTAGLTVSYSSGAVEGHVNF